MEYLDFDVEISPSSKGEYLVTVIQSPAGEARERIHFPYSELQLESRLKDLKIALLRATNKRRQVISKEEQTVRQFGSELFDLLLPNEIRGLYRASLNKAIARDLGLRLKLRLKETPELAALPWEFLYDKSDAEYVCLAKHTPIVRYIELQRPLTPLQVSSPLRILGMVASPTDLPKLDVEREKERVSRAVADLQSNGLVELTWLHGQTWRDLQKALRREKWHIFHFIGHGGFNQRKDEGYVALCDRHGREHPFMASELARLLANQRALRLVLLNACEGGHGGQQDIFSSTASILVRRGIPAVLAMQYEITDKAAIELARSFYEALSDGLPVDSAITEARQSIGFAAPHSIEWVTPVLYMRSPNGKLFDIHAGKAPSKSQSKSSQLPKPLAQKEQNWTTDQNTKKSIESFTFSYLSQLSKQIVQAFSQGELNDLCFQLEIEYEDLPGDTRVNKTRELIKYLERRGQLSKLVLLCEQERSHLNWREIKLRQTEKLSTELATPQTAQSWEQQTNRLTSLAARSDEITNSRQQDALAYEEIGAYLRAAEIWQELGDTSKAIELYKIEGEFEKAAGLYETTFAWADAAALWQQLNKHDKEAEALAQYAKTITNAEEQTAAWQQAVEAYTKADQPVKAAKIWHEQLGKIIKAAKLYEEARELEQAANLYEAGKFWVKAANLWQQLNKHDKEAKALTQYAKTITNAEGQTAAWQQAVEAYTKADQPVKAAKLTHEKLGEVMKAAELYMEAREFALAAELYEGWENAEPVFDILREFKDENKKFYFTPNIPTKKLKNAKAICQLPEFEYILALHDVTFWGSAKSCLLFGAKGFYFNTKFGTGAIPYSEFPDRSFIDLRDYDVGLGNDPSISQYQKIEILGHSSSWALLLRKLQNFFIQRQSHNTADKHSLKIKSNNSDEIKTFKGDKYKANSIIHEKTGLEFVRIPAGEFLFGEDKKLIHLPEYWISKTPVTNSAYKRFTDAIPPYSVPLALGGEDHNWDTNSRSFALGRAKHPVTSVSWNDAMVFCEWAGLELPTEEQWEKAARGTDGRKYPWGDQISDKYLCNFENNVQNTAPVGAYSPQGDSPYGCVDMSGNVSEYVKDNNLVTRGGNWNSNREEIFITARGAQSQGRMLGFRVVLTYTPQFDNLLPRRRHRREKRD